MSNHNSHTLPPAWTWTTLGELLDPSDEKVDPLKANGSHYIGLEHIEKGTGKLIGRGSSFEVRSTKNHFHRGDLLYGKLRPYLNKVAIAQSDGICSTDILVFKQSKLILTRFTQLRLLRSDFVRFANQQVSGVQHPRVDFKKIAPFPFPLPPLPEQRAIVAKIEQLFSELENGVANLKKAQAQLKTYRQAVLKWAFEGKLTEEWRKERARVAPTPELGMAVPQSGPCHRLGRRPDCMDRQSTFQHRPYPSSGNVHVA